MGAASSYSNCCLLCCSIFFKVQPCGLCKTSTSTQVGVLLVFIKQCYNYSVSEKSIFIF